MTNKEKIICEKNSATIDLEELIDEDWFDEINYIPKTNLISIEHSLYAGNSFYPSESMILHFGEDGTYYIRISRREPIGDYGWSWHDLWYKCNNNSIVKDKIDWLYEQAQ